MSKEHLRLQRQLDTLGRSHPALGRMLAALTEDRQRLRRIPLAVFLILGSFLAVLPVFGLWMLPAGLLLLAVDVPALRPFVSRAVIVLRRWFSRLRRRFTRS